LKNIVIFKIVRNSPFLHQSTYVDVSVMPGRYPETVPQECLSSTF